MNFGGTTVSVVKWDLSLTPSATDYYIRVVVIDKPSESDSIYNIAFAVMHGDTISSTGTSCYFAEIGVKKLWANNDYYAVLKNGTINSAYIGKNDIDKDRIFVRDSILYVEKGTAVLNSPKDGTLKYTTPTDSLGIDSIGYRVKTANDSVDSKAFVAIITPSSDIYTACPGAVIEVEVLPYDTRLSYEWYSAITGGTLISSNNDARLTMGNKDTTVYVQVYIDGNAAEPRIPVTVYKGNTCGGVTTDDCIDDGTVIFREDFGGNNLADPRVSPTPLPYIHLTFLNTNTNAPNIENSYWVLKYNESKVGSLGGGNVWFTNFSDHTHPGNLNKGYMLMIDATDHRDVIYEKTFNNLCAGYGLYISANVLNLLSTSAGDDPGLKFEVLDTDDNILGTYFTGDLPKTATPEWKLYGFPFDVPAGMTSIKLRIVNYTSGAWVSSDYAVDDIEVRLCTPPVTSNVTGSDTLVCIGTSLELVSSYTDDGSFGGNLTYKWEYRAENSSTWTTLLQKDTAISGTLTDTITINPVNKVNEGYYRMLVSAQGNMNNEYCRASTDSIFVKAITVAQVPDIRIKVCPYPVRNINLTSYLDSLDFKSVKWEKVGVVAPTFVAGTDITTGTINTGDITMGTYSYLYSQTSQCGTTSAKMYLKQLGNIPYHTVDTVAICRELELSSTIQLNQILGLEANGTWDYTSVNPDNTVANNVDNITSPSKYAGALIFNAKKAWEEAGAMYGITYNTDVNAKKFKFRYTTSADCGGVQVREFVIIVTDKIL